VKRICLIYNPTSGPRDATAEIENVSHYLEHNGCPVEVHTTHGPGDATTLACRAAFEQHVDIVLVAGGDGTLNEAINGLAGSQTALGVLPIGTGNVWAKELGLPAYTLTNPDRLLAAAHLMLHAPVRSIDLGRAGERCFLLWAGIGFDAQVAATLEPRERPTKRLGILPYIVAAVHVSRAFRGERTIVWADGKVIRGHTLLVVVSNAQLYGGVLRITPNAQLDDGYLDVCIFKGYALPDIALHAIGVFTGRHLRDPKVKFLRARRVQIDAPQPWPVQIDGDHIGTTPMNFQIVPAALKVLVPPTTPAALFKPIPAQP
jgi:YegS/Rv2252/BmrU family lipid kinase